MCNLVYSPLPPDNLRISIGFRDNILAQGMAAMKGPYEISEHKEKIFDRDNWRCINENCTMPATELAHRIAQSQQNERMVQRFWNTLFSEDRDLSWIRENVIHHSLNLASSCRGCNDYFNIGNRPRQVKILLVQIWIDLQGDS